MPKEVFFIADDFGRDADTNRAIREAHVHGALHGASLMMGQPGTEEAVAIAHATPTLRVGLHLHFNDSHPCTRNRWPWRRHPFWAGWWLALLPSARRLIQHELREQWRQFQHAALHCAFINSHHHLHCHPIVGRALRQTIGRPFDGWIRYGQICRFSPDRSQSFSSRILDRFFRRERSRSPYPASDTLWGIDRLFRMNSGEIETVLPPLDVGRHEFLFHPRTQDNDHDMQCLRQLNQFSSFS